MSTAQPDIGPMGSAPESAHRETARAQRPEVMPGDLEGFGRFAVAAQDRIYNTLRKLTGNEQDAADLTQETFAQALGHFSGFRNESSAFTWLYRIALNLATTRLRQTKRRRTVQAGQLQRDDAPDVLDGRSGVQERPEQAAQSRERAEQVTAALARLPEEQRKLLVLRDVEDMEYQQIAELLDVPLGTLKSRLFRARLALREALKPYFGEDEA